MSLAILLGAALLAGPAAAACAPRAETAIPFVSSDGINDWKADGDRGLFIESVRGRWYYVSFASRCPRIRTARGLGFETSALDQLDRHGAILAEGWRCQIVSLTESPPPPRSKKRR